MVLLLIAGLSLLAWVWLALFQGWFWRTDVTLPARQAPPAGQWPAVTIVVPARNEASVLPLSLPSLLRQRYPGQARVILIDDDSDDGTGAVAQALSDEQGGLPLTVATPGRPAPGWTGKLWAVRHGVGLADTEFVLLTDADIAHGPDSLAELVAAALTGGYDLVSQMARLRTETRWERLIVPAFVYLFAQLYPFRWVNRADSRTAASAGGCVLVRRAALERARIPESIRQAVIDDVALARAIKGSGGRIWLGLARQVDSVRPYPHLAELWRMVSRSAYAQLRHSPLLLTGTVLGLVLVYLVPPVAALVGAFTGWWAVLAMGAVAWALLTGTGVPMLRYYRLPSWTAVLLPFTALLYLLMTVDSAIQHHRGRGAAWKGRTYPAPDDGATQRVR